jgi:hypothetical protein
MALVETTTADLARQVGYSRGCFAATVRQRQSDPAEGMKNHRAVEEEK